MKEEAGGIYHIYNEGNNLQLLYADREEYLLFLKEYRRYVHSFADTLCYCLIPNHIHFLIHAIQRSVEEIKLGSIYLQCVSNGFRRLLSAFAHHINKKRNTKGSLFRQKTMAKRIDEIDTGKGLSYAELCFYYIHQNPVKAMLVERVNDWEFSSARDYLGERSGTLCNKKLMQKVAGWQTEEPALIQFDRFVPHETTKHFYLLRN
ncbi:MAG: hypothetical protein NZM35_05105 [Chitinophagales bacterium]|nr:hypothetical protein [Chitinophagales bacterium]MDW8418876.1 hypothetical protein [Chitinophagales bacterium]